MFFLKLLIFIAFFFNADYVVANDKNDNHEIKIEVIGKSKVNVRTGPGTQYDVVGQVNPNEWMWVYGEPNIDKEWVKATKMGLTGYVNTRYVRVVEESHVYNSYKGLDFFETPEFFPNLKIWAWNLVVVFFALLIFLWILFAIIGKGSSSFVWALSMACTSCIIWYSYVLGDDAFWFVDPDVSGGWMWTILYGAIFLIFGFGYLYTCIFLIGDSCDELDEFQDWVWFLTGLCAYLILNVVARLWVDWTIWIGYAALGIGILVQTYKILTSAGVLSTILFLFTCVGVYIMIGPFLYILAFAALFGLVAIAFLQGSQNDGRASHGSNDIQYEGTDENGRSIIVTCSRFSPQSGYGDDGHRYEQLPNGSWRRV